jgi:hypothetical protein
MTQNQAGIKGSALPFIVMSRAVSFKKTPNLVEDNNGARQDVLCHYRTQDSQ